MFSFSSLMVGEVFSFLLVAEVGLAISCFEGVVCSAAGASMSGGTSRHQAQGLAGFGIVSGFGGFFVIVTVFLPHKLFGQQ